MWICISTGGFICKKKNRTIVQRHYIITDSTGLDLQLPTISAMKRELEEVTFDNRTTDFRTWISIVCKTYFQSFLCVEPWSLSGAWMSLWRHNVAFGATCLARDGHEWCHWAMWSHSLIGWWHGVALWLNDGVERGPDVSVGHPTFPALKYELWSGPDLSVSSLGKPLLEEGI